MNIKFSKKEPFDMMPDYLYILRRKHRVAENPSYWLHSDIEIHTDIEKAKEQARLYLKVEREKDIVSAYEIIHYSLTSNDCWIFQGTAWGPWSRDYEANAEMGS